MKKIELYQFNLDGTPEQQEAARATGTLPAFTVTMELPIGAIYRRVNARILQKKVMGVHPETKQLGEYVVNEESAWLWAEIETNNPLFLQTFYIIPTGAEIPLSASQYLGTILLQAGAISLHIYT